MYIFHPAYIYSDPICRPCLFIEKCPFNFFICTIHALGVSCLIYTNRSDIGLQAYTVHCVPILFILLTCIGVSICRPCLFIENDLSTFLYVPYLRLVPVVLYIRLIVMIYKFVACRHIHCVPSIRFTRASRMWYRGTSF